jgi:hypothetical protein
MILLIGIGILVALLIGTVLAWLQIYRGKMPEGNGGHIRSRYY